MELSYVKEIVSYYTNVTDRQTDELTDHGTVTSIPIGDIAFSDVV